MNKINELTPQQHSKMLEFREEYRRIGTSCEPADFESAKQAITRLYERIGKPAPKFLLCQSPMQAQIKMNIMASTELGAELRDEENVKVFYTSFWGQLDSYWVAYYLFPHLCVKPMYTDIQMEILNDWDLLCKSCGWWWAFENLCFICDRFSELHQDSENRLHNPNGAAMAFRDGYSIYAIHGTVVPSWIITNPEKITASAINSERNIEIRRVMLERLTPEMYLQQSNAVLLDTDWVNQVELYEITADDGSTLKMTKSTCHTTGQEYVQIVPHQAQTAYQALCLRYGVEDYAPVDQS